MINDLNPLGDQFDQSYARGLRAAPDDKNCRGAAAARPHYLVNADNVTFLTPEAFPPYTVVSYTWGRWRRRTREMDTPVVGGYWKVPANNLFTREELDRAIRNMSGGISVWLDVLCIPQDDDDPLKKVEIGKQSEIFRSASRAVVWLCSGGEELLVELCSAVPATTYMIRPDLFPLDDMAETRRRLGMIVDLPAAVPWTTSLWTLQEAALRLDSVFCGKAGHPLRHAGTGDPITIQHFVKTLREFEFSLNDLLWDCAVPPYKGGTTRYGIADNPSAFDLVAGEDVASAFEALRSIDRVALRRLVNMNAAEVMQAAAHRVCERDHDRVYGIMGAIGITVPVDYRLPAPAVMDMFLAELHRTVPAEMQGFRREGPLTPGGRQWLVDTKSEILSLVRQLSPPAPPVFQEVTDDGCLMITNMLVLREAGLEELISRSLTESMLPTLDNYAVSTLTGGEWGHEPSKERDVNVSRVNLCHILRNIASRSQLGLVPLGCIAGMERLSWRFVYVMVASTPSTSTANVPGPKRHFHRFGLAVTADEISLGVTTPGPYFLV